MIKCLALAIVAAPTLALPQDPDPPNITVASGSSPTWTSTYNCAKDLIDDKTGLRLTDGKSYCITPSFKREAQRHHSKGGFSSFGNVSIPGGACQGSWDGVIGISVSTGVKAYKGSEDTPQVVEGGTLPFIVDGIQPDQQLDYVCGIFAGLLMHEFAHEAVQDFLVDNCGQEKKDVVGSDCAEVLAKLATVKALQDAIKNLDEEITAEEAKDPEELDQDKIDKLKTQREALQDVLDKEIEDLNRDVGNDKTWGEDMLDKCPTDCTPPISEPTSWPLMAGTTIPNPIGSN